MSIVIVNYNGAALLPAQLESIARQSFANSETLLVDSDSPDVCRELVRRRFPTVTLIELDGNEVSPAVSTPG